MAEPVQPVKPPPTGWPRTVAYPASAPDLESLELSVRRDEGNWASADISSLTTTKDDNIDVTAVTYKKSERIARGTIMLVPYSLDPDIERIKKEQSTAGATFLFPGKVHVANKEQKVLVFRRKLTP